MRTPVEVTDEVFARMKEYFSDKQIVEITALLTLVNVDRFNAAARNQLGGLQRRIGVRPAGPPRSRTVGSRHRLGLPPA